MKDHIITNRQPIDEQPQSTQIMNTKEFTLSWLAFYCFAWNIKTASNHQRQCSSVAAKATMNMAAHAGASDDEIRDVMSGNIKGLRNWNRITKNEVYKIDYCWDAMAIELNIKTP
jgi:hypothetical protein